MKILIKLVLLLSATFTASCAEDRTQEGDVSVYKSFLYPDVGEDQEVIFISKYTDSHFFTTESVKKISEYFDGEGDDFLSFLALSKSADMNSDISWKNSMNAVFTEITPEICSSKMKDVVLFSDIHYSDDGNFAYFTQRKICTGTSDNDAVIATFRKAKVSCTDINLGFLNCTDWVSYSKVYVSGI